MAAERDMAIPRFALLVVLLGLAASGAHARGGGGRGGDRACNPNANFERCMDKCAERQGGIGDNKDHNKCAKRCSRRVCPS
jgi:hypothetical protein